MRRNVKASIPCIAAWLAIGTALPAQDRPGTGFYGDAAREAGVCPASSQFVSETEVDNLVTEMLSRFGARNRYIIISCPQVDNCQAMLYKGRPYILFNPDFLQSVKRLNFSASNLPAMQARDWAALTILAHELGHHINNHLINPLPDATARDMELEADQTAGFIIYMMGGEIGDMLPAYLKSPEQGSYTHPPRKARTEALEKGYRDAAARFPRSRPADPKPPPVRTTTDPSRPTDIDGNAYSVLATGGRSWMGENLNVSRFRNGDPIPQARNAQEWRMLAERGSPAWCHVAFEPGNDARYGKLYNGHAVLDPRGLAPEGWTLPQRSDWEAMLAAQGIRKVTDRYDPAGYGFPGGADRLRATFAWTSGTLASSNASGFSLVPSGGIAMATDANGAVRTYFYGQGVIARLWCTNRSQAAGAAFLDWVGVNHDGNAVLFARDRLTYGMSVRCVRRGP
jgi:uncharacterized protein (TIGR02145 family)